MAKKQSKKVDDATLNAKRELFCRYYTQNTELYGNAVLSYAEAYGYDLASLDRTRIYKRDEQGNETLVVETPSEYDRAYHVCGVESSKLLKKPEIQARMTAMLNELLKDEVVDSQLAKLIVQDVELPVKVRAIGEYNKLRGRIIDKTQNVNRLPFGETDLSTVIATLPKERQDYFYGVITSLIAEAELLRSAGKTEGGGAR
jgi:hypothetical protein